MDRPSLEGAMDLTTGASAESASPAAPAWRSRWLTVARRAWPVVTGLALVANLLELPAFARSQLNHTIRAELPAWHLSPAGYVAVMIGFLAVFMLVCLLISAVIFFRAAEDPVALLCAYMLMAFGCGLSFLPGVTITDPALNALSVILTSAGLVLVGWFFLVFPSGRFVPRWSRWCVLAAAAGMLVVVAPSLVKVEPAPDAVQPIGILLLVLGAGAQVYRYCRVSTLTERQQTKWVMLGVAAFVVVFAATRLIGNLATTSAQHTQLADNIFGTGSIFLAFAFIPVCIGIAVLRTRLWDIGLVISRTLTYTVVTALLVGVYAGLVLLATRVLAFTAPVAVAASTLAAAAVFNPLHPLAQRAVDRRFNRARYDADQAVAAFAARLQDAADPDAVHAHLLAAVHQALEPAHASVWIRQR
jgi:xanthosine utilization system XapX-like protein